MSAELKLLLTNHREILALLLTNDFLTTIISLDRCLLKGERNSKPGSACEMIQMQQLSSLAPGGTR